MPATLKHWRGIVWIDRKRFRVQIHTPQWTFDNGDWFLRMPTIVRAHSQTWEGDRRVRSLGFGVVVLGFGFAITSNPSGEP